MSAAGREDPGRARARDLLAQARQSDPQFAPRAELTYALQQELGRGGAGVVHLVQDQRLGRQAALKLLHDQDPQRVRRFRREAELTARLDHPGVPPVYAAGTTLAGQPFLAMRYVHGESLAQRLSCFHGKAGAAGKIPSLGELLAALVKVGETLAYAHARGVIHRDLKPANVMLADFGEVLVVDWGLARDLRQSAAEDAALREELWGATDARLTREGVAVGTLGYMAPEQAQGEDVGAAADVFALGAILTEVLTGEPPFAGASQDELLVWTCLGKIEAPRDRRSDVAAELDSIARRALATDPAQRYEDARAFAVDLQAYLDGQRVSAHRYGLLARGRLWSRQHPVLAAAAATVSIVLAGALPYIYGVGVQAGVAARVGLVAEAETEAEARFARLDLQDEGTDRLGAALSALSAAQRWHGLSPDDPSAAEGRLRAALALGAVARETGQWTLAGAAVRSARGLGHDDQIEQVEAEIAEDSEAEARGRRLQTQRLLDEAERGELRGRPGGLRHAIYQLARDADPATVETLCQRLEQINEQLEAVLSTAWAEAAQPTPEEAELGAAPLEGLREALDRLSTRVPGDSIGRTGDDVVTRAAKRILRRSGDTVSDFAPRDARARVLPQIGVRQREALGEGSLRVAELCCVALGRLESNVASQRALRGYLRAEADQVRALAAARALLRLGDDQSQQVLRSAILRFGLNRPFDRFVTRLLAVSEPLPVFEGETASIGEVFERGSRLLDRGEYLSAARHFELITRADPKNGGAWGNLGLARAGLGDLEAGMVSLERAMELMPDEPGLLINRATILQNLGRVAEAEADLRRALQIDSRYAPAFNGLGSLYRATGRPQEALRALDQALEHDPQLLEALANRAQSHQALGQFEQALADIERALRLDPTSGLLYGTLASIHQGRGDQGAARLAAKHALELEPNEPTALGCWALVLIGEGRLQDGYEALTKALEHCDGPSEVAHLTNRANCAMQMDQPLLALEDLRAATELDPTMVQVWWMLGMVALNLERLDEAKEAGQRTLDLDPQSPEGWRLRGNVRLIEGDLVGAREDVVKAANLAPGDSGARLLLGFILLLSGDEPGAEEQFRPIQRSQPYASVWLAALGEKSQRLEELRSRLDVTGQLARYYLGQVSPSELEAYAEQAAPAKRGWVRCEVQTHLGLAALRKKDQAAAAEHFRRAVATEEEISNALMVSRWLLGRLEKSE